MGDIAELQRRLFPHSSSHQVLEISQVPLSKSVLSIPGPSFWPINSSDGVHLCGQRGQVNGSISGYKDPPVPRRLVDSSPYQRVLPPGHPIPPGPLSGIGLGGEPTKIRVGTQTGIQICWLPIRPLTWTGQWVTSLNFSDAYFHIPVHIKSWKYLGFHFQNQSYQFRALPFGLSTAPMEFTCVVKEVKLMAQSQGIRIHQYLDDWLIRAPTKESCHQGTQSLLALCQELV